MTPQEREDLELQASEYALGSLSGDERARFERVLADQPWLQQRVDEWNRRLGPLAEALAPVAPSPAVWSNIEARIAQDRTHEVRVAAAPSLWDRIAFWRWTAIGGVAAAAALLLYVAAGPRATLSPDHVAILNDSQAKPAVIVVADVGGRRVAVRELAPAPAGRAHELWIITGPGQAPRSLGVITAATAIPHAMPEHVAQALPKGAVLAVSLEPAGGSPTGAPTGPVLYTGSAVAVN
jgi:anti-sigma-K factor RskA